jgi:dihydroorotase
VEIIRLAKARGIKVTAEVTPHHLSLLDTEVASYDPAFKVNPPLRTADDVAALREALADGTIDCVATDHAPHPPEQKDQEWDYAPCGMLGLETAFAVVVGELVNGGHLDLLAAVERFTSGPARVRDVGSHGRGLGAGDAAHIVVIDPDAQWTVSGRQLQSRARNTPFEGRKLTSRPVHTLFDGRFTLRDGKVQR